MPNNWARSWRNSPPGNIRGTCRPVSHPVCRQSQQAGFPVSGPDRGARWPGPPGRPARCRGSRSRNASRTRADPPARPARCSRKSGAPASSGMPASPACRTAHRSQGARGRSRRGASPPWQRPDTVAPQAGINNPGPVIRNTVRTALLPVAQPAHPIRHQSRPGPQERGNTLKPSRTGSPHACSPGRGGSEGADHESSSRTGRAAARDTPSSRHNARIGAAGAPVCADKDFCSGGNIREYPGAGGLRCEYHCEKGCIRDVLLWVVETSESGWRRCLTGDSDAMKRIGRAVFEDAFNGSYTVFNRRSSKGNWRRVNVVVMV